MDIKKVPNFLTVIRAILVPVFMVLVIFPIIPGELALRIVGASLFLAISLTDMLDGMIARKYNAVSDFGKFLDPIADKLLVMGGMLSLVIFYMDRLQPTFAILIAFSLFVVMVRELAVTSLRLIYKNSGGKVIAANMAGKIKTVSQIVFIIAALIETPLLEFIAKLTGLNFLYGSLWVSYAALAVMTFMTIYSGIQYFVLYLPSLKDKKD